MKVLHIISGGDTGGAKTSVLTLMEALKLNNVEAELLCFQEGIFAQEARLNQVTVHMMEQKSRFDLSILNDLRSLINDGGYDLINTHGARANFLVALIKRKVHIPLVTTIHSDYKHDFENSVLKKIVFTTLNAISLRRFKYFITMADYFKRIMVDRGFKSEDIHVAYNGVDIGNKVILNKTEFLNQIGIQVIDNTTYVGIVSRLHPIKGVDVFINAAAEVCKDRKNVQFLIAGDGDYNYTDTYKRMVNESGLSEYVHFIGFVEDVHSFYNSIDINVNSSHSEAVCYALLEGGMHKKATVCSNVGGTPELIQEGMNGLLFEDNDFKGLAKRIEELIENQELRMNLGDQLYTTISSTFSVYEMGNGYKQIYEKILRSLYAKR